MSIRWTNHILSNRRDLKGAELLCALIIANYASADDRCYPGLKRIADDMRCSVRHVSGLIQRLADKKVFKIHHGDGRGNKTSFELLKDEQSFTVSESQKDEQSFTVSDEERANNCADKGGTIVQERANNCADAYKEVEPVLEPVGEPVKKVPDASAFGKPRNRPEESSGFHHPVIAGLRSVTGRSPSKETWTHLINKIGNDIDLPLLAKSYGRWKAKGYKTTNFDGILDFYLEEAQPKQSAKNGGFYH